MKIVAIGGGEIGRPGTKIETGAIDRKIIRLSGKKKPRLLFIPTASGDSEGYVAVVQKYFGKKLGCKIDTLLLTKSISVREITRKVSWCDIMYVGGGNTKKMLAVWRRTGFVSVLQKFLDKKILSGLSAGAVCWFACANSDFLRMKDKRKPYNKLKCLGFIPLMLCPHYDCEVGRRPSLHKMILKDGGVAIALDNCAAIEIVDDSYRIIVSLRKARAYVVRRVNGRVVETVIRGRKFKPLASLSDY